MTYQDYTALKQRFVPTLHFNQAIYEEAVASAVSEDTAWLDAGTGWHILPSWRGEMERSLADRARIVIGCDADEASLQKHRTLRCLAVADLEQLPFAAESIDLLTCNMVVEHLQRPHAVFAEFARVLRGGAG